MRNTTIPKTVTWEWVEREIARHLQMTDGERSKSPVESLARLFEDRGQGTLPTQYQRSREPGKGRRA